MTNVDVQGCRVALAAAAANAVATVSGQTYTLTASDFISRSALIAPFFGVGEWTENFDTAMARGNDDHTVLCRLFAQPAANDRVGSALLAAYMKPDGASSIRAALSADRTLGGKCQSMRVLGVEAYAVYTVGADEYIGAQWRLSIW